ncbi:hypothetical protein L7F22_021776 [Adiantum nelumboides]|nr:hypothetical protein [Adiantum nelumboides]
MGESTDEDIVPPQDLLERLKDYGQEHCLDFWKDLTAEERNLLLKNLEVLDLPRIDRIIKQSLYAQDMRSLASIEPVPEANISTLEHRSLEQREKWWNSGLKAIADGKLAVLLLSGGQGTRLGTSDPKGCFSIGLPSGKSLFQLQAERILRVQTLASLSTSNGGKVRITWYIMTSLFTTEATQQFFERHKYFGLEQEQVIFFEQGILPCISKQGKFILETSFQVSRAPDGNGGVYAALKVSKCLDDMATRGIKYVDCFSVDNALVRVADPLFLGYVMERGASCAAKVIKKAFPQEKVGVFARRGKGGPLAVVEYSELDHSLTHAINQETGRLRFNWSNVCLHMFSLEFLNEVTEDLERDSMSDEEHTGYGGYLIDVGTAHGLAILNGLQRIPTSSGFTCFPHRHGASTLDYVLAQPSFVPSIQDFTIGPMPIGVAVHALLTFPVSSLFSTAQLTQTSTHTRLTFTLETDFVYVDGIYRCLCIEEPGRPLEELTYIFIEKLQDVAAEAYPHTEPGQRRHSGSIPQNSWYHIAEKKISSLEGSVDGIKLEQFVFDVFPYSSSLALFEVLREEEFAPVKNASGATADTPDTARLLLLNLHTRWVVAAGGFVTHSIPLHLTGIEVSPLRSYAGENLEDVCRNRTFHAPCEIRAS